MNLLRHDARSARATPARPWSVRLYQDGDEEQLNQLFIRVFDKHRTIAQWKWKFHDNPLTSEKVIVVGTIGSAIVGMYPCVMSAWKVGAERVMAVEPVETAIEKTARDGRLIGAMFKAHVERGEAIKVRFSYGTPNDAHYKFGKRRLGYRDMTELAIFHKGLNLKIPGVGYIRRPFWFGGRNFHDDFARTGIWSECLGKEPVWIGRLDESDGRFDRLWEKASGSHHIISIRNGDFLKWRYFRNPFGEVVCLGVVQEERLLGYLMLFLRHERKGRAGIVADLLVEPGSEVEDILLEAAGRYCRSAQADYMRAGTLVQSEFAGALLRSGFIKTSRAKKIVYLPFAGGDGSIFQDPRNWYLTLGDFDFDEG